jgi:hypothetical protein
VGLIQFHDVLGKYEWLSYFQRIRTLPHQQRKARASYIKSKRKKDAKHDFGSEQANIYCLQNVTGFHCCGILCCVVFSTQTWIGALHFSMTKWIGDQFEFTYFTVLVQHHSLPFSWNNIVRCVGWPIRPPRLDPVTCIQQVMTISLSTDNFGPISSLLNLFHEVCYSHNVFICFAVTEADLTIAVQGGHSLQYKLYPIQVDTKRKRKPNSELINAYRKNTYLPGVYIYMYVYTSSTAQGGGGSFKNRKPIG